jgi:tetratricopeptide (TPR) repeat protein
VALSLLPENPGRFVPAIAERLAVKFLSGAERPRVASAVFYEGAVEAAADGRSEEALILLAALLADDEARLDGLLGLAVLAMRLEAHDAALALAQESLQFSVKHPRACCIAGLCELERGDRKAAQTYFAAAARIARSRPEFREDLQTAQRALLMMHLA